MLVASEPPHARLCFKKRKCHPPVALRGMVPPFDLVEATVHLAVEVLDAIGGLQAPTQLVEEAESVQR